MYGKEIPFFVSFVKKVSSSNVNNGLMIVASIVVGICVWYLMKHWIKDVEKGRHKARLEQKENERLETMGE